MNESIKNYIELSLSKAYRLIGHGPLILVCSRSKKGWYNIAPIAWNCPVKKDPFRIFMEIGMKHKTYSNIIETKEFTVCVPSVRQLDLVKKTGSSKGSEVDKFAKFDIKFRQSKNVDIKVPVNCIGYIECKLLNSMELDGSGLIIGEAVYTLIDKASFRDDRLLTEKGEGKTIHHLGAQIFTSLADEIF